MKISISLFSLRTLKSLNKLPKRIPHCCIAFAVVVATLTYLQYERTIIVSQEIESETLHRRWHEECPTKGGGPRGVIVTIYPGGRLGNAVWAYLSVWSYAQRYDIWPAVPSMVLQVLENTAFTSLKIPSIEDLTKRCNISTILNEFKKYEYNGNIKELKKSLKYEYNKNITLLILKRYTNQYSMTIPYWRELSKQLELKPELLLASQVELNKITKEMEIRAKVKAVTSSHNYQSDIAYVAVHVRRTDYIKFRKNLNMTIANETFYFDAMKEMKKRLKDQDVIFVVVSDDPDWCKKYLSARDVVVAGTSNVDSPGHDLALLASCNHSIFAYGTFAITASLYNTDGITIVPKEYFDDYLPMWVLF